LEIKRIAIVGGGTMGTGIAHVCATSGFSVIIYDIGPEFLDRAMAKIRAELQRAVQKGKLSEGDAAQALGRISTATDLSDAARDVDFVIEAVPEDLGLKRQVFLKLDELAPKEAILATNTSSISISRLASVTKRPAKVVGMHFFNPPHVMKLVEVVKGEKTSDQTVEAVRWLAERLGKTWVLSADRPGFIVNRLLIPFLNEAALCLMDGVASARDIDTAVKLGLNHPMGPLELADLIGIDTAVSILEYMLRETGDSKYRPCQLLKTMVGEGKMGRKSGSGFYSY